MPVTATVAASAPRATSPGLGFLGGDANTGPRPAPSTGRGASKSVTTLTVNGEWAVPALALSRPRISSGM